MQEVRLSFNRNQLHYNLLRLFGHFGQGLKSMNLSAQISIYPLRQARLGPAVEVVRAVLTKHGLSPQVGPMSTLVIGDDAVVFAALTEAFAEAASLGEVVMTVTASNACPAPD
jgi:uncharacterized protein YqgV (UPF0045/DUF77 family)